MKVESRASRLGITIPRVPTPQASYVPTKRVGNIVFTAGMGPVEDGIRRYLGRVGEDISVEDAYRAAQIACVNCLAAIRQEIGDLDQVKSIIKVNGYIRSAPGFTEQHKILNGASELLEQLFAECGKHSRVAIGVSELPFGIPIEIEMIVEVENSA